MSDKIQMRRLEGVVQAVPEQSASLPTEPDTRVEIEANELARELVRALTIEMEWFRREKEPLSGRPNPNEPPPESFIEWVLTKPPEDVHFAEIEYLRSVDPARAMERWNEIKAAARQDLDSGWMAARTLEYQGGSAWLRACFAAIRDRLRNAWPPRNSGESLLIDEMAQYEMLRQRWLEVLVKHTRWLPVIAERGKLPRDEEPRRLSAAKATEEALRMVAQLQRLYQNALRTLLSLRPRSAPSVTVHGSGQVNVALAPQMNLCTTPTDTSSHGSDSDGHFE